ncbi:hypothetical protein P343_00335 [Sporolactobacillus laevolacticus DSM 442]|uniref:Uncharacterized protein n=1 Tax=Sporolactobacillus laevolacticus DSM 442 TaxID=1395513 RepID=V6J1E1_9BACL|nr:hypothetical protein P343_00335 [Sporolactobacillus laevolacticus DSM 442]
MSEKLAHVWSIWQGNLIIEMQDIFYFEWRNIK